MTSNAAPRSAALALSPVAIRVLIILAAIAVWEVAARSGLFYQGVFPSVLKIVAALWELLTSPDFYWHLSVTAGELVLAIFFGGTVGAVAGYVLGVSNYLSRALEKYVYYVSATPKIIFLPIVIIWFGVDSGSKIGLGAVAAFFPVCLNIASGVRSVNPVFLRVGAAFKATRSQVITKIYLPAIRGAAINAARLGLAVAIISVLLAETKLAKNGLGYLVTQAFNKYDMPTMYALIFFIFIVSVAINTAMIRMAGERESGSSF
ncbi:ABC transporter permease [Oricola sp.]|uniref:ABC transporter permease n=1 Tax=Oricola sp. TaxID=1979950 RepID=UPI0025E1AFA7|nr:ABC transporter permease [Oricola sp.]MCI5077949.1 ABC transporter permease [Oricola sp.]